MEHKDSYKSLTKASDFIALVVSRTVEIINDKLLGHVAEFNDFITTNNIIGLKKKHLVWTDLIKNYTNITSCLNNLIGFSHEMNYTRKFIFHNIAKPTDNLKEKLDQLLSAAGSFLDGTKSVLISLEFIAKNLDIQPTSRDRDGQTDSGISNLFGIISAVRTAAETIEKQHLPKVRQLNKTVLESASKKGGSEISALLENFTAKGGLDISEN